MTIQVIAEIGNNHNGDPALARRIADAAIAAGADWIKVQVYHLPDFLSGGSAYFGDLARESLSFEEFTALKDYIEAKGGRFLATPFDIKSLDFLHGLGLGTVKIASGDIDNLQLIGHAADLGKELILSVGCADLAEIDRVVALLREKKAKFTLLHCVLSYPAAFGDCRLRFIESLARRYGVPVGYSDHTLGIEASLGAIALGAVIIEKHFTIDRALPGGDNEMSILPEELARLKTEGENIALALGSEQDGPSAAELAVRRLVRRSWHATRDLAAGTSLTEPDVVLLRPATPDLGFASGELDRVTGQVLRRSVARGEEIARDAFL